MKQNGRHTAKLSQQKNSGNISITYITNMHGRIAGIILYNTEQMTKYDKCRYIFKAQLCNYNRNLANL